MRLSAVNNLEYLFNIFNEKKLRDKIVSIDKTKEIQTRKDKFNKPIIMDVKKFM